MKELYWPNLKQYWREHIAHVAIGALAGHLFLIAEPGTIAVGFGIVIWVATRQTLEYLKRDDTPGIDLAYYMGGLVVRTLGEDGIVVPFGLY